MNLLIAKQQLFKDVLEHFKKKKSATMKHDGERYHLGADDP